MNDIVGSNRTNKFIGAKLKKEWTDKIAWEVKAQKVKAFKNPVYIEFRWFEPNKRRDPDNFIGGGRKLILDGLVMAGVLKNDGWKNVAGFIDLWFVDKENPRIELIITMIEEVNNNGSNWNIYVDHRNL